jgi:fibronectin-binding autotransporter adhesin
MRRNATRICVLAASATMVLCAAHYARAAMYWDTNGGTAGCGNAGGNWGNTNWSTSKDGTEMTLNWAAGGDAVFSAGTDGTGSWTVNLGAERSVKNITVEEGNVTLGTSGSLRLPAAAAWIANAGTTLTVSLPVNNNGCSLAITTQGTVTLNGALSGGGDLEKYGTSMLVLNGNNTYSGSTTIYNGTVTLGCATGLGDTAGNTRVASGATLDLTGKAVGNENLEIAGAGGGLGALVSIDTGTASLSGSVILYDNATIGAYNSSLELKGAISTTDNNYTLTFNAGSGDILVSTMGIGGGGAVIKTGSGTLTLSAANSYTGATTISAGVLQIGAGGATGSIASNNVANNRTLVFNRSDNYWYGGAISGAGTVSQRGAGTLTLSGSNTYSGGTVLYAGTLRLGSAAAIGSTGSIAFSGGTLAFSASNTTDYSGRFSTDANQAYNINTNNQSVTFASALTSSGGSLNKFGPGTLTLAGNNTYTSTTTVNAGVLQIGSGGTVGWITTDVVDNGDLTFNRSGAYEFSYAISGTGSMTVMGGGTLTLSGTNTYSGPTDVEAGALRIPNATALGSGDVSVSNGAALQVQSDSGVLVVTSDIVLNGTGVANDGALRNISGTSSLRGAITLDSDAQVNVDGGLLFLAGQVSGGGGLAKNGAGTLVLGVTNNYAGSTTVNAGVLAYDADGATGPGNLSVSSATLSLGVYSGTANSVTLTSGAITGTGTLTSTGGYTVCSGQISATLAGSVSLTKSGSGTVTLSGANVYTGTNYVNAGALVAYGTAAITAVLTPTATTDIAVGKLVFDYTGMGTATGESISDQVKTILAASYNGGTNSWASGTIYSTLANTNSTTSCALGWTNNTTTSTVTVKLVLYGDATMDGTVNIYDLGQVLANYNKTGVWATGDFNYDGTVNIYDLGKVLANYNKSLDLSGATVSTSEYPGLDGNAVAALQAAGVTVVPEPGMVALLTSGIGGLLAYGWRRRK